MARLKGHIIMFYRYPLFELFVSHKTGTLNSRNVRDLII